MLSALQARAMCASHFAHSTRPTTNVRCDWHQLTCSYIPCVMCDMLNDTFVRRPLESSCIVSAPRTCVSEHTPTCTHPVTPSKRASTSARRQYSPADHRSTVSSHSNDTALVYGGSKQCSASQCASERAAVSSSRNVSSAIARLCCNTWASVRIMLSHSSAPASPLAHCRCVRST
jgi:hypothetical protein